MCECVHQCLPLEVRELVESVFTLHHVGPGNQTYIRLNGKTTLPTEPFISHHGNDFLILKSPLCVFVHVHTHAILPFAEKKMELNYEISSLNTSFISLS